MRLAVTARHVAAAFGLSISMVALSCSSANPAAANSFTEVYTQVIQPNCTNAFCHYQYVGTRYGALDMSSQVDAYWSLVDQLCVGAACSGNGNRRVIPGDPEDSIMYLKVSQASPPCGVQMPADVGALTQMGSAAFSGTALTADQQNLIYNWILEGAPNN
jgi:hypothetical protein